MAKGDGKTLEKLYFELGLDLSQLQADILAADKTVTENLGRLNREKNTIKLRVEADIADEIESAKKAEETAKKAVDDAKEKLMRLTLIKSGIYPNPNADQGLHEFTYSLFPHEGDYRKGIGYIMSANYI